MGKARRDWSGPERLTDGVPLDTFCTGLAAPGRMESSMVRVGVTTDTIIRSAGSRVVILVPAAISSPMPAKSPSSSIECFTWFGVWGLGFRVQGSEFMV